MRNLSDFIGPAKTRAMKVRVVAKSGKVTSTFDVPEGFQLERYVDALYPENELMVYDNNKEINVSVLEDDEIGTIFVGTYK